MTGLSYPVAEPRPETVTFGDISYQDPFRWLEEDADPVVTEWQVAQDAMTQDYLRNLPAFGLFAERLELHRTADDIAVPIFAGGRWFTSYVPDDENLGVVTMSDTPTGAGRRIVDLNAMQTGEPLQMLGFVPSPDGRKAVINWAAGGRDRGEFQIIEIDTGTVLVDGLPQAQPSFCTWLPDGSGILYTALDAAITTGPALFRLDLGAPDQVSAEPLEFRHPVARPMVAADRRHVLLCVDHLAPRPDFILDTHGDDG